MCTCPLGGRLRRGLAGAFVKNSSNEKRHLAVIGRWFSTSVHTGRCGEAPGVCPCQKPIERRNSRVAALASEAAFGTSGSAAQKESIALSAIGSHLAIQPLITSSLPGSAIAILTSAVARRRL